MALSAKIAIGYNQFMEPIIITETLANAHPVSSCRQISLFAFVSQFVFLRFRSQKNDAKFHGSKPSICWCTSKK